MAGWGWEFLVGIEALIEYQLRIASGRLSIVLVVNDVSQFVACGFVECEDTDKPISGDVVHACSLVVVSYAAAGTVSAIHSEHFRQRN